MHFTEEENFQRIFEDLSDFSIEIHLYMKKAGGKKKLRKPETELHKNCLQS